MLTRKQQELLLFINERLQQGGISPSFDEMKEALGLKSKSGIHRLIIGLEERGFIRRLPHRARALDVMRLPDGIGAGSSAVAGANAGVGSGGVGGAVGGVAAGVGVSIADAKPAGSSPTSPRFQPNVIKGGFAGVLPGRAVAAEVEAVTLPLYGRIAAGTPIEALRDHSATIAIPASLLAEGEHYALEIAGDSMVDAGILDGDTVVIRRCDSAESGNIVVALVDNNEVTLKRLRRKGQAIALEPANAAYETRIFGADRVRVQGRLVALLRHY
jgi:repressor LexA